MIHRVVLLLIFSVVAQLVYADGMTTQSLQKGSDGPAVGNGGFLEVSLGYRTSSTEYIFKNDDFPEDTEAFSENMNKSFVEVSASYRYNGFFIEAFSDKEVTLGYNFWSNKRWAIDFIAARTADNCRETSCLVYEDIIPVDELEGDPDIVVPDAFPPVAVKLFYDDDYNNTGIRATAYLGSFISQFGLYKETKYGNGFSGELLFGRFWQIKNWNFHGSAKLSYISKETQNGFSALFVTLDGERATSGDIKPGFIGTFELGATYPINEHWISRTTVSVDKISKSLETRGLYVARQVALFSTSISYVF